MEFSSRHFELIQDLVATCGFDGYFKQLNGAWERSLGWAPEQLLPKPFLEVVHGPDRPAVEAEVARQAQGATTSEFKFRIRTADGCLLWTEWSASPDPDGLHFHCVGRVIQRRVEMEEIALVGSWEIDLDDATRTWSAQQHRNHGFEPSPTAPTWDEFFGRIHPEDRAAFATKVREMQAEPASFTAEYRVVLPDASTRQITVQGRPVIESGRATRLIGTSRDVTAERDAERLKDEFIGLVSHELRTPLTSIIGYTELLAETESDNLTEQGQRFVEVIDRNSRRELNLVGDLLMLTKISAGTFTIKPTEADLAQIARATYEAAEPEAANAGINLCLEGNGAVSIIGDPDRLVQVAENLVSNAIKFTPEGGDVTITTGNRDGMAIFEVADTGIGIESRGVAAPVRPDVPGGRRRAPPYPGHRARSDDRKGDRRCARGSHRGRERAGTRRHLSRRAPICRGFGGGLTA